jgi:hypothetical protein
MMLDPEQSHRELVTSLLTAPDRRNPGDIERISQALRRVKPLHSASEAKVARLSRICHVLELQAGEMVFCEDDEVNCFHFLLKGTVRESSALSSGVCWSGADHTKWYGEQLLHQVCRSCSVIAVCVGRYRLLSQVFGPGMQEDGRNDKSVECVTNVLMIAIHRHSLYSHFKDWLEEDTEKDRATLQERSINAAHSFKVGSALWRPGVGLAVVDNVDITKFPYEFWVSFRDGQTSAFLPDAMFTLFKKLPADSLRGDDVEQHRRARMSMLMMHTHMSHVKGHGEHRELFFPLIPEV